MVATLRRARARALPLARMGDRGGGGGLRPGSARPQDHRPRRHRGSGRGARHGSGAAAAGVLIARAVPMWRRPASGARVCWPSRCAPSARSAPGALGGEGNQEGEGAEVIAIVPADGEEKLARASDALANELEAGLSGFTVSVSQSRVAAGPGATSTALDRRPCWRRTSERPRAARVLAFEDTGAYRLLLPGDERGPGRARALLLGDRRAAGRLRRAVRDRPGQRRSRPIWRTTGTSPPRPSSSTRTATRSATGWSAPASSAVTTSPPPRGARSSGWA